MNMFARQTLTKAKQNVEIWKVFQFRTVTGIIEPNKYVCRKGKVERL